ncbi:MAG: sigma-54-dependent Fis family transcriptional regulator [Desulfobulbaceae bacterium]|nr:MAG: sigma-54-dependent Fis family transcriptional regulator [Desulfobulbaceae bacterium]
MYDSCSGSAELIGNTLREYCLITIKNSEEEFQAEMNSRQYDLVLLGIDDVKGPRMQLLEAVQKKSPYTPVVITSANEKAELVVKAMNTGACDFLVHPVSRERITMAVERAIELRNQRHEIDYLRHRQDVVYDFKEVIANSVRMKAVLKTLKKFAGTDSTILITGDTGTGKSFLSGTVHFNSPRKKKPFVKINCANIPEDLLESELFGHEKGAFTSADKQRIGRFEQASGGTIFLDEIGEISLGLQSKLLRVLEEKSFERVGGNKTIYADIRIIAATNKDLVRQVEEGKFREDLYYRINVLPVALPPLRSRQECIMPLALRLLNRYCKSVSRVIRGFSDEAREAILGYDWPGNIRQLANTIERAVILEEEDHIQVGNLALPPRRNNQTQPGTLATVEKRRSSDRLRSDQDASLAGHEKELILRALEECLWVQKSAANKLGISPRALNYKIKKWGITHPHWRRNK